MSNKNKYRAVLNKINGHIEQLEFEDYNAAVAFCNIKIQDVRYEEITLYYQSNELASWNWYLPRYIDIFGSFLPEPEGSRLVNHYKNLLNIPVFNTYKEESARNKYREQYVMTIRSLPKDISDTADYLLHEYATQIGSVAFTLRDLIIRKKLESDDLFHMVSRKIRLVETYISKIKEDPSLGDTYDTYRDIYVPPTFLGDNGKHMIYSSVITMSRLIRELGFPGFYGCDFFVGYAKGSMECKDADKHIESRDRKVKYRRFFDETMWEKTKVK